MRLASNMDEVGLKLPKTPKISKGVGGGCAGGAGSARRHLADHISDFSLALEPLRTFRGLKYQD